MDPPWDIVQRRINQTLNERARQYLLERAPLPPHFTDADVEDLVEEARELLEVAGGFFGHGEIRRASSQRSDRLRHQALSEILAIEANGRDEVCLFRRDHLSSGLLDWRDVESWIKRQSVKDGAPSARVLATWIVDGGSEDLPERQPDHVHHESKVLAYSVPEDSWRRLVSVNEHGVLGRLRCLSEQFAEEYAWQPGQATVFVLTGLTPETTALRVTRPVVPPMKAGYPQPWRMRIQIDVDLSERPETVARAFRDARSEILRLHGHRRARLLSERAYTLAVHAARRPEGESWRETMRRWDAAYPSWAYGHRADAVRQFRSEACQAIQRTLDPYGAVS